VPASLIKGVVEQLKQYGATRRGWLGVHIQTVNDEMAEALGMEKPTGALVASVSEGGPAELAGIKPGDVILMFDGKDVTEMHQLPRMVADTEVGKAVRVVVFRKGKTQTLKVTIALLDETEDTAKAPPAGGEDNGSVVELDSLGLRLAPLGVEAKQQFGIADEVSGVVITAVAPGSPAEEKGVRPGDVIVEVGQEPVSDPAEVEARIATAREAGLNSVLFLIQSGGDLRFVPLSVDR